MGAGPGRAPSIRAPHSIQNGNSSGLSLAQAGQRMMASASRFKSKSGRADAHDVARLEWAWSGNPLVVHEGSLGARRSFESPAGLGLDDPSVLVPDLAVVYRHVAPDAPPDRRRRPIDAEL